jgi:hypothetical protein
LYDHLCPRLDRELRKRQEHAAQHMKKVRRHQRRPEP